MAIWPQNPILYEINTWVWLNELRRRYGRDMTLADVPPEVWDNLADLGMDAIWLMGVWERSPQGTIIAREHPGLRLEYRRALPDYTPEDVVGSPYCIHDYEVDAYFGGNEALAAARGALASRGLRLLLDYVPNHVAVDHPWVYEHPDILMQGDGYDLVDAPDAFFQAGGRVFAHGRDPYFPAWTDTAQVNAFSPGQRRTAAATLSQIAHRCDGVRCDMAMLLVNRIFERTWGSRAGSPLPQEFWSEVIGAVKQEHPEFLFLAEAYWDMEWELQQQGFDFCYDKRLYDRLAHDGVDAVRAHLLADLGYQKKLVRFTENHDEPRAAVTFGMIRSRAAAVLTYTLPGARLFFEGQAEGQRVKLPVQLGRQPEEPVNPDLRCFYRALFGEIAAPVYHAGTWQRCVTGGWPDNPGYLNLAAWCWRLDDERRLIVVNLSEWEVQGRVCIPWDDLAGRFWRLTDVFTRDVYTRNGDEMRDPGLYVALGGYGYHLLQFEEV